MTQAMPLLLPWSDIALRLALATVAGGLLGLDRGGHGKAGGLRTTLLVTLAAALAMILANILLDTTGKSADSFIHMDVMRLPLGILTGIGFIGAGAIFKNDMLVVGVTTAATLWFATMVGLCFGGGAILLGCVATALGLFVLFALKAIEPFIPKRSLATLDISGDEDFSEDVILQLLTSSGASVRGQVHALDKSTKRKDLSYEVAWRDVSGQGNAPAFLRKLADIPGVTTITWRPIQLSG